VKAVVKPVWTYLQDVSLLEQDRLDKAFAIPIPGVMFQPRMRRMIQQKLWDGCFHFYDKKQARIQSGLLQKLRQAFPQVVVENHCLDNHLQQWADAKVAARTVEINGITFSTDQRNSIISAVENVRGIQKLATNAGKTEVGAGLIKALQLKALWVIHLKGLLHQTAERLELRLGMPVGRIGDGIDKPQALVDVAMMQSIRPKTKAGRERLAQYDVILFDEAHHLCSDTQQSIAKACVNAPFRYAFGGSFPKEDIKRLKIMAATDATVLYDLTNKDLIASGWSASPTVHIQTIQHKDFDDKKYLIEQEIPADMDGDPEDEEAETDTIRRVLYHKVDEDLISNNPKVDEVVLTEIEKYFMKGMTTLVLVDRLAHGERLGRKLGGKGINYEFLNGSHNSAFREAKLREFKKGTLPVIIATSILDEGIDVPRVQCVVLAGGGKSSVKLLQRLGRALRRKQGIGENVAHIVDFFHFGSKYSSKHAREREKVYKSEEFEIVREGTTTL
jgi:superfamily II DNA or RNA helicase